MTSIPHADQSAMGTPKHALVWASCQEDEAARRLCSKISQNSDRLRIDALFLEARRCWSPLDVVRAELALRCARLTRRQLGWHGARDEAGLVLAASMYFPRIVIVAADGSVKPAWARTAALFASRVWRRAAVAVLAWPGFSRELGAGILCVNAGRGWPRELAEQADLVDV